MIYFVQHRESGKTYVGQTTRSFDERWHEHVYRALKQRPKRGRPNDYFHTAMHKHGVAAFDGFVIENIDGTQRELDEAETWWIAYLRMLGAELYNLTDGGDGRRMSGWKHTSESKQLMSKSQLNIRKNPEVQQRYYASTQDPVRRKRLSTSLKRTNARDDVKKRRSISQLEAQNRPEVKVKRSASLAIANAKPHVKVIRSRAASNRRDRSVITEALAASRRRRVEQVDMITLEPIATYLSIHAASQHTGVHHTNISRCVLGNGKQAGGFKWRYV